ncbi:MAG TPA: LuxR C-terminal-related transcriptional regulator, partial [Pseudonocardia sp.]
PDPRRAALMLFAAGPGAGARISEPLLERAHGRALVWASFVASFSMSHQGRLVQAIATGTRGDTANFELTLPLVWPRHVFDRSEPLALAGRFAEAGELIEHQYRIRSAERSLEARAACRWQQCKSVGERGHVRRAIDQGREAVRLFEELEKPHFQNFALVPLALAYALAGRVQDAAAALDVVENRRSGRDAVFDVDLLTARAWTAVAGGNQRAAQDLFLQAADLGERIEDRTGAAGALHGLARIGRASAAVDRLTALAEQIDGELASARAAHARHLTLGDAEGLLDTAKAFERMGANLLAAEATADAAVAHRRHGSRRGAARAEHQAAALARRCEGADTPALHPIAARSQLTTAERDCATLAAAGHTNKQIAAILRVSVRTVESHLHHSFHKLGISRRLQLTEFIHEVGNRTQGTSPLDHGTTFR